MSRQQIDYNIPTYEFQENLPERIKRFQQESGLSWSEIAHQMGTYPITVWRWETGRARPNYEHRRALVELADDQGLARLLID